MCAWIFRKSYNVMFTCGTKFTKFTSCFFRLSIIPHQMSEGFSCLSKSPRLTTPGSLSNCLTNFELSIYLHVYFYRDVFSFLSLVRMDSPIQKQPTARLRQCTEPLQKTCSAELGKIFKEMASGAVTIQKIPKRVVSASQG